MAGEQNFTCQSCGRGFSPSPGLISAAVVAERVKLEMAGSFSLGAQHNPMFLTDRDT